MKRRRGRRRKQLLDDFKEKRGNCKLKEKALDRAVWKKNWLKVEAVDVSQSGLRDGRTGARCVTVVKSISVSKRRHILKLGGS